MRLLLLLLCWGCVEIAEPRFDNPCDPAVPGACNPDALVGDTRDASATGLDARRDAPPSPTLDAHARDSGVRDARVRDADSRADLPPKPDARVFPDIYIGPEPCPPASLAVDGELAECGYIDGVCAYEFYAFEDYLSCAQLCATASPEFLCYGAWWPSVEFWCEPVEEYDCGALVQEMVCLCGPG